LFDDEEALHTFMSLTEEKSLTVLVQHRVDKKRLLDELEVAWSNDPEFERNYITDYLQNEFTKDTTSWTDKYTSTSRNEFQSPPDYIRWLKSCDLHYLPYREESLTTTWAMG